MPLSIEKGESLSIEAGLNLITLATSWDVPGKEALAKEGRKPFDLDLVAVQIGRDERTVNVTYFNRRHGILKKKPDGTLYHSGAVRLDKDNLDGAGDGDDEQLWFDFSKMPKEVVYVDVWISLYGAKSRKQHLGEIAGASARVFKGVETREPASEKDILATMTISDKRKFDGMTAIHFVRFFFDNGRWEMKNMERPTMSGLEGVWEEYKISELDDIDEDQSDWGNNIYPLE